MQRLSNGSSLTFTMSGRASPIVTAVISVPDVFQPLVLQAYGPSRPGVAIIGIFSIPKTIGADYVLNNPKQLLNWLQDHDDARKSEYRWSEHPEIVTLAIRYAVELLKGFRSESEDITMVPSADSKGHVAEKYPADFLLGTRSETEE